MQPGGPLRADTQGPLETISADPVTPGLAGRGELGDTGGDLRTVGTLPSTPRRPVLSQTAREGIPGLVPSGPPHPPRPPSTSQETSRRGSFLGKGKHPFLHFFLNKPTVQ